MMNFCTACDFSCQSDDEMDLHLETHIGAQRQEQEQMMREQLDDEETEGK